MKYNSIGEQLIAKAQELDPNYKPDKFNDMSEALDVILNNTGGDVWLNISPYVNGETMTISQEGFDLVWNSFSTYTSSPINKYAGIDIDGSQKLFFDKAILSDIGGKQGLSFIYKINIDGVEGCTFLNIYEDKSVEFDSRMFDSNLTLPQTAPTSQLIPSITTNNEQQNLSIGDGLKVENGVLKTNNIPELPSDASTKTYVLKSVNGVLTWSE